MEGLGSLDLIAAQEEAIGRFAEASPEETLALAEELAATMRVVVEDEELWGALAEASGRTEEAGQLRHLVLVDWEPLLEQWGVPEAKTAALELIEAVTHADDPGDWTEARELLGRLTELLEGDLRRPQPEKAGWLRRVRDRAAAGYSALRRVRIGGLAAQGGKGMAEAVVPTVLGIGFAAVLGPVGPVVGAAVGGLGVGLVRFLRGAVGEPQGPGPSALDDLFDLPALTPFASGAARADLELLGEMSREAGRTPVVVDLLADLRLWAARIGATLAAAGPLLGAHLKNAGLRAVDQVMVTLHDFLRALRRVAEAADSGDCQLLADGVDRARGAMENVGESLWRLQGLVEHRTGG